MSVEPRKLKIGTWRQQALLTFSGVEHSAASESAGAGVGQAVTKKQQGTKADKPTYTSEGSGGVPMRAEFSGDKPVPGGDPAKKEVSAWREQATKGEALNRKANPAQNSALNGKPSAWRDLGSALMNERGGRAETVKTHKEEALGAQPEYKTGSAEFRQGVAWRTALQKKANEYQHCPGCGYQGDTREFAPGSTPMTSFTQSTCPKCGEKFQRFDGEPMSTDKSRGPRPKEWGGRFDHPEYNSEHSLGTGGTRYTPRRSSWRKGGLFESKASGERVALQAVGLWQQLKTQEAIQEAQVVQPALSAQGALKGYKVVTGAQAEFKPKQVVVAFLKRGTLTVAPLSDFAQSFQPVLQEVAPFDQRKGVRVGARKSKAIEMGTPSTSTKREGLLKKGWRSVMQFLNKEADVLPGDTQMGGDTQVLEYYINLDERGSFSADVRDASTGQTVYDIKAGAELGEDEQSIFDDGYMSDPHDVQGLLEYLKELGIVSPNAILKDMSRAERGYGRGSGLGLSSKRMPRVVRGQRGAQRQAGVEFTKKPDGQINISVEADPVNGMGTGDMLNGQPVEAQPAPEAPEAQPPTTNPAPGEAPGPVEQPVEAPAAPTPAKGKKASIISVGQMLTDPTLGQGTVDRIVGDRVVAVFGGREYETTIQALSAL
jgi:hypothetical protein